MLISNNITMQFGNKPLFENISVKFVNGYRYGLIGANGCGKSTLMKILGGDLIPTSGNVSVYPNKRLGKLRQDQFSFEKNRVLDTVIMGHVELWDIKKERDHLYSLTEISEQQGYRIADLELLYDEMNGYTAEARAGELLLGLGISLDKHYGLMNEVAPGWKLRVLLAQALFSDPDILLLDEPTNNLDIHTIHWLEEELNARNSTMIIISHDRHFLNTVCTHIADLDYGKLSVYPGNYDSYIITSTQEREHLIANNAKKKAQIAELKSFIARFSANASKSRQATSRVRQINKIKLDSIQISSRQHPFIRFQQEKKLFRYAVKVEQVSCGFNNDSPVIEKVNMIVESGEKVAIIGNNGIGKTTLLRTLLGKLPLQKGQIKWSENACIGYYAQDYTAEFIKNITVFEWMNQWKQTSDDEQTVRSLLGQLLFCKNDIKKSITVLSGGEKGRMLFGKLMMQKPNIIVMDEPTNHLDMESIESLNIALELYQGTLLFVSHDRKFVNSLATRIVEILPGKIINFRGTYENYLFNQKKIN
ncbi:ATPase component of ABC transporters with duplicated ATPase domain [secondary endosymbiont of Heteropsylla cubana]|uniref:Probable ATP-binding protein YbiT n=1 Tax=secondary endosymbiont of Heteropsylla cubana TaxID=134287 RepID=J3TGJ2_9ENTR|nr:ABC-F family ATPase [secondary endosymbiont of Heteropsylla cubana]AFP85567.1 ATPase component of ABC transporters with duplicated ATPase domain [secondary endosymbiont of Heteropsylla cubana]